MRHQLELALGIRPALRDEPDGAAAGIGRLDGAREELLEIFLAPHLLAGEGGDLFDQPLDARAGGFDALFLGHWRGCKLKRERANATVLGVIKQIVTAAPCGRGESPAPPAPAARATPSRRPPAPRARVDRAAAPTAARAA